MLNRRSVLGVQSALNFRMPLRQKEQIEVERHSYSSLVLYEVSGEELDALESETSSIVDDFSFGSISLTLAVAFTITLTTTKIASDRMFLAYFALVIIGYLAALFFGIRWFRGRGSRGRTIKRIKSRVGPLGQEGKEINPKQLAALPSQEAPQGGDTK